MDVDFGEVEKLLIDDRYGNGGGSLSASSFQAGDGPTAYRFTCSRGSSFSEKFVYYHILKPERKFPKLLQIFPSLVQMKVTFKEMAGVTFFFTIHFFCFHLDNGPLLALRNKLRLLCGFTFSNFLPAFSSYCIFLVTNLFFTRPSLILLQVLIYGGVPHLPRDSVWLCNFLYILPLSLQL